MIVISANMRGSLRDLEDDLDRARANLERSIGLEFMNANEDGVIKNALDDFAWETSQAIKTLKQQILASKTTP
jgi:hypothetical protein